MKTLPRSRRHWTMVRRILLVVQKTLLGLAPVFGVPPYFTSEDPAFIAKHYEGRTAGEMVTREEEAPPGKVVLSDSESVKWNEIVVGLRRAE